MTETEPTYRVKVILCGASAVGKSSLLARFANSRPLDEIATTIGIDFCKRQHTFTHARTGAPIIFEVLIWDTAGQERFRAISSAYYRGTHGALMVFDVTDRKSFKQLDSWVTELRRHDLWNNGLPIILVGNKIDLIEENGRHVSREMALEFARTNGLSYIETSAKTNTCVDDAFTRLFCAMLHAIDETALAPDDDDGVSSLPPRRQTLDVPRIALEGVKIDASPQPRRVRSNSRSPGRALVVAPSASTVNDRIVLTTATLTSPRQPPPPPPPRRNDTVSLKTPPRPLENSSCC